MGVSAASSSHASEYTALYTAALVAASSSGDLPVSTTGVVAAYAPRASPGPLPSAATGMLGAAGALAAAAAPYSSKSAFHLTHTPVSEAPKMRCCTKSRSA